MHARALGCADTVAWRCSDGGLGVTSPGLAVLLAVLGGGLVVAGVALIYWPAALIVAGVLLLAGLFGPNVE